MRVLLLCLTAIIGYGLGSFNGAITTSRLMFNTDVRRYGSGNAGLTNYFRNFGVKGLLAVVAVDVIKTLIAVLLGGALLSLAECKVVGQLFAGFCVIMGHMFPVLFQFRGGKGVLCGVSMLFVVDWRVGLLCTVAFAVVVIFTRYVSLGSVVATILAPLLMLAFGFASLECVLAALCALLIVVKHAENLLRIANGSESKLDLRKGVGRPKNEDEID